MAVAETAEREAEDRPNVPRVEQLEGLAVAIGHPDQEIGVALPVGGVLTGLSCGCGRRNGPITSTC